MGEQERSLRGIAKLGELGDLVGIVLAVSAVEPMVYCPGDEMSGDWYECGFCGAQADALSRYGEWGDVEHQESCEWRRARDWVDAHPA